jgi:hypothetical protein
MPDATTPPIIRAAVAGDGTLAALDRSPRTRMPAVDWMWVFFA